MRWQDRDRDDDDDVSSYRKPRREERSRPRRREDEDDDDIPVARPRRHSRFGIASFVVALSVGMLLFLVLVIGGIMEASTPGGIPQDSPQTVLLGLLIIGAFMGDVVAVCLGIAGWCEPRRKKVFAILGTVFGAGTMLFVGVIMLFGLLVG